ncbi:UxaA family hydrolase [Thermoanaerobacter sp. CM-CNRG TB177]|jgi:altronate dehydratase large subunit|uniref:Altronate dehydratase n=2 Tax=Thermoanaerobacter TaxID=1754 RepID=B0KBL9_THEP3|nr:MULTISPECIES: UxaA family hydrolase [Thermoanaerobacter]KUJ90283.1 MAG: altronate dehydratase [Thermoanaerobacter thermocopriae]MDN5332612.1 altronate dehydratase large subunit [Tepidanaerobacteraceae bacterium]ABY95314.1 Altronate dehydratase [Thermoanaerobacter pseudethanolicus ATCC 33223]ADV80257.1 Altronate dehydratase [Thermoanaerobacter brockii subsp. finnii Ako-1]MBT1278996.1 UxaA family hydrolase [Thermoanaerobacter sp. CM-CNRG TB177]
MKIMGYVRPDGRVGIRNHILIIPSSVCASEVAMRIASHVEGAVALANQHGCCQIGADLELTAKTLVGLGKNPNVAAALVVGLGCEGVPTEKVAEEIAATGKRVEYIIIQDCGGTLKAEEIGTRIARQMAQEAALLKREEVDISNLILAVECGGSDTTSGLASNPVAGYVSDKLIELGGTSMFSETTEIIGAEHLLAKRAVSREVADKLLEIVRRCEEKAKTMGVDMRGGQPTPGNIEGGISTIEEKSMGAIYKGGTKPIQGILDYAEPPAEKGGLYIMDTPGQDIESITGMTAGGAQVVIFTTGRGTPTGSPIAPVIKITANPDTYKKMEDNIDFNAGTIVQGDETIREAGERLFKEMIEVVNGKLTKAEVLKHREFGIYKLISTF